MTAIEFIHELSWENLPGDVQNQARRCLLDTLGSAMGGRSTEVSRIIHEFAAKNYSGQGAVLWFDGRSASPPGAALANGMTINSLDIHDGYRPVKGHVGAGVIPALLSVASLGASDSQTGFGLLTSLVVGYEIATRAGVALHRTACDYHTSGAWNALGAAAVTSRKLRSNSETTRHSLGIAEYHGPRSQMMRVIDHPTMLKDGSGWGSMAGVSAGLLAAQGFTGAPAITLEDPDLADLWGDLGVNWRIRDQYFKPYAVCYWAQPAVTGALKVQANHPVELDQIDEIRVYAFHEATRLDHPFPESTDAAQYSLPFPLAAVLVHGKLGSSELAGQGLKDSRVLALSKRVRLIEVQEYNDRFPEERFSRVEILTRQGEVYDSGTVSAKWDVSTAPPTDEELLEKFHWLAGDAAGETRSNRLQDAIWGLGEGIKANDLIAEIAPPFLPHPRYDQIESTTN